jgi:Fanconi anemia group D2 protein|tara:strand:+ start:113 stop:1012 length:900 start_codon:yes stop_codon:yes gene_type:complete
METPELQKGLISTMLQTLCTHATNDDDDDDDDDEGGGNDDDGDVNMLDGNGSGVPISTTILQHLRWLDFVEDSSALSNKLTECIHVCPFRVQRDIILMLPEIVGDVELNQLVAFLLALMEETPALTVSILDALTNLHLNDDTLSNATERVILTLQSSEPDDLPVVVRFLLTSCRGQEQTFQVLKHIRQYLSAAIESNDLANDDQADNNASNEAFILEALRVGFRQRSDVANMYLKGFANDDANMESNGPAQTLDVWILATMHGFLRDRKAVETTLKKLVIGHKLDESTVSTTVWLHCLG